MFYHRDPLKYGIALNSSNHQDFVKILLASTKLKYQFRRSWWSNASLRNIFLIFLSSLSTISNISVVRRVTLTPEHRPNLPQKRSVKSWRSINEMGFAQALTFPLTQSICPPTWRNAFAGILCGHLSLYTTQVYTWAW